MIFETKERTITAVTETGGVYMVWLQQSVVDEAFDERKQCFSACVYAKRRHFEHLLQKNG